MGWGRKSFPDSDSIDSEIFKRKALDYLCGKLMEEVFDDDSYHLNGDSKTVQRKLGAKSIRKRALRKLKVRINKNFTS